MKKFLFLFIILFAVLFAGDLHAQQLFMTANTNGFGSPGLLIGFSAVRQDVDQGEDFNMITARGSIGIGLKTDIFGSFDGVLSRGVFDTNFTAWSAGLKHQFIRTNIVDLGGIARIRGNHTSQNRFEDALLDFAGIVSLDAGKVHPYYAVLFSRPFGLNLTKKFQKSSVIGAEVPIGDIPRVFGEVSLGDRRSFGIALALNF